jgi:hypothetical protein
MGREIKIYPVFNLTLLLKAIWLVILWKLLAFYPLNIDFEHTIKKGGVINPTF